MQRKRQQQQHEMHTMLNNKNCFGWIVGVGTQDEKMKTKKRNENFNYLFFLTISMF